jgi:hypothetical protein
MRCLPCVALVAIALLGAGATAIDLDVDRRDMEVVLRIARGPAAERMLFHAPYVYAINQTVERLEVVTELRRLVQIAEARIAGGDRLFAQGTLHAEEALRPWRRRVAVVVRLRFHPQNAYVMAPPVDIRLNGSSGEVSRLDMRSESVLALSTGIPGERLPIVGATAEALFDATIVGQRSHTVTVRMEGKEIARLAMDFGRFQ